MDDRPLFGLNHKEMAEYAAQDEECLELVRDELAHRTSRGARKLAASLGCECATKSKHSPIG